MTEEAIGNFEELSPEQRQKAHACKTAEDILALAQEEGYGLSDDELEGVSGGWLACSDYVDPCPDDSCKTDMTSRPC